jgi:hypothetical protein
MLSHTLIFKKGNFIMAISLPAGTVRTLFILIVTLAVPVVEIISPYHLKTAAAGPITYHVDCNGGNDGNSGTGPAQAWKSLGKANGASLVPGDSLLFIRGCTWSGTLKAKWNGTAAQPIIIGAYGTGALPKFQNGPADLADRFHANVNVTGSYQTLQYLETTIVNPPVDPGCLNNPLGFYVGFNFENNNNLPNGGSYNTLIYSKATRHMAGAHTNTNTHHNRILRSEFTGNNAMSILTPVAVGAADDLGAWGVLLKGNNHEVGLNYFANNNGLCAYDTPPQGNSIELYEAKNNVIHHNTAINDRDFSELGGSAGIKSDNNTYAYNLVVSNIRTAHFIIARGGGNRYGPTAHTNLYNNVVHLTGAQSEAIVCHSGCSADILTAKNNILWAEQKVVFADGAFNESNNIYWSTSGTPFVQFMNFSMNASSKIVNPQFVNPGGQNFRLRANSPAINAGLNLGWAKDLDGVGLPQGGAVDIGGYEYRATASAAEAPATTDDAESYLPTISVAP